MTQRRDPIRSKALRRAAAGQPCTIEFVGICSHDNATTVLAHLHDETFGKGMKADDTSGVHGCNACHMAYDLRRTGLSEAEVLWYILRAYQRTIRNLVEREIIIAPIDAPPKPKAPKSRRPKEQRQSIPSRKQKMQSKPFQQRRNK